MVLVLNILETVLGGRELPVNYENNTLVEKCILTPMRRSELSKYSRIQHVRIQSMLTIISKDRRES